MGYARKFELLYSQKKPKLMYPAESEEAWLAHLPNIPETAWQALAQAVEAWAELENDPNAHSDGRWFYSKATDVFFEVCADTIGHFMLVFDWMHWSERAQFERNPAQLVGSPPIVLVKMMTSIVRGERFCDGLIRSELKRGSLQILCRELLKHRPADTAPSKVV
jgi:hypothetical protein